MKKTKKAITSLAIAGMLTMIPFNALAESVVPTRLGGTTAEQTAALIADQTGWTGTAVLASSASYGMVDALTASPLATFLKAPILLTGAKDVLNSDTKAELTKLNVKTVYVTSGTAVIRQSVLDELTGMGITVVSLGGSDRFQTSVNIAKTMISLGAPVSKAAVAFGWMNQDALSISSIASAKTEPILLTEKNTIPASVKAFMTEHPGVITTDVIGGTGVISDAVKAQFPNPTRLFGNTAYDTNVAVLKAFDSVLKYDHVFIANGETAIDALTGAPLAAKYNAGIVLTNGAANEGTTYVSSKMTAASIVTALGGTAVVPEIVRSGVAPVNPVAPVVPVVPVTPGGGGSSSSGGSRDSSGSDSTVVTIANVSNLAQLNAALDSSDITTINLLASFTASPTVTRPLTINFGANTLTGDVKFLYDGSGTSVLTGDAGNRIAGSLTVNTSKASFKNGVKVSGAVNVVNVEIGTWTESADGNTLTITDSDGAVITVTGHPGSVTVAAGSTGALTLTVNPGATVTSIITSSPMNIVVAQGATVTNITASTGAGGTTITNNGTATNVTANAPINLVANVAPGAIITGAGGSIEITGTHSTDVQVVLASAINVTTTGSAIAGTVVNGGTLQMSAKVMPETATNKAVRWSVATLAGGTATIDASTGLLQATGVGTVTVTATNVASGVTGTKVITVVAQTQAQTAAEVAAGITTITIQDISNLTLPTVPSGFTVAIKTSSNPAVITTGGAITIPSVNTTVALVFEVTKISDATTASSISIDVVVYASRADAFMLSGGVSSLWIPTSGATTSAAFTATVKDQYGYEMPQESVTWSLPGYYTPGVSVNTTTGAITLQSSVTPGTITLRATLNGNTTVIRNIEITLNAVQTADTTAPTLSGVTTGSAVIGTNVAATSNEAGYLYLVPQATVTTPGAIDAAGVTTNGIKVAATAGVSANLSTTGFAAGTYVVYAIDVAGNVSTTSAAITLNAAVTTVSAINVTSAGDATTVANGGTLQMSATVTPTNATNQTIAWSVATLAGGTALIDTSSGYLQATGVGTVTVTATNAASGVTGTKVITVVPAQAVQLTITAPTLTLSKVFDSTTSAAVTAGSLVGVAAGDTVTVSALATYDTAAVGTSKAITVVYTLGGANAGSYIAPVNYTTSGAITAETGFLTLTYPKYEIGESVFIAVFDADLRGQGTLNVNLSSTTSGAGITVQLIEDINDSNPGAFFGNSGNITADGANGTLKVSVADVITATYFDQMDVGGNSKTTTASAIVCALNVTTGSAIGSTMATVSSSATDHFVITITSNSVSTPGYNALAPAPTVYSIGADIGGVNVGQYLQVYDVDANGVVVKFYQKQLTIGDIKQ